MRLCSALGWIITIQMINTLAAFSNANIRHVRKNNVSCVSSSLFWSREKDHTRKFFGIKPTFQTGRGGNIVISSSTINHKHLSNFVSDTRHGLDIFRFFSTTVEDLDSVGSILEEGKDENEVEEFFEGECVSFITAGDGIAMAAIKVKDDDIINSVTSASSASVSSSSSKMFGKVPNLKSSGESKKNGIGQGDDLVGRKVHFKTETEQKSGVIVAQRHPVAFVLCDFDSMNKETTNISILKTKTMIDVSSSLVGKIVNYLGDNLIRDEGKNSKTMNSSMKAVFEDIPKVNEISLINSPLLTGITTIDALTPIGKGQNMLIVGDNKEFQRNIVTDILSKQVKEGTKCVYACTSADKSNRSAILSKLKAANLLDKIVTVCARDNIDSTFKVPAAAEAVAVSASACAMAETFATESGEDTLVIVDVLDFHKDLWDSTTRTLVDIYGEDSVVKGDLNGSASSEMRAYYSSLIQRSAKFNKAKGGGSLTLLLICSIPTDESSNDEDIVFKPEDFDLTSQKIKERIEKLVQANIPLTASTLRKIQIPIPAATESSNNYRLFMQHIDDLISMSDGQIWLVNKDEENSTKLMLDVQRSITRIGIGADTKSRADAPALQALTGGIRFELAQSLDAMEATSNTADRKSITKRDAWLLSMYQNPGQIRTLSEECVALMAVKLGVLDNIVNNKSKEEGLIVMNKMLKHVWNEAGDDMKGIDKTLDFISDESRTRIENAIENYFQ